MVQCCDDGRHQCSSPLACRNGSYFILPLPYTPKKNMTTQDWFDLIPKTKSWHVVATRYNRQPDPTRLLRRRNEFIVRPRNRSDA
eukprot:scaffold1230_cov166-Amphora_coffeaeformis.AAC.8